MKRFLVTHRQVSGVVGAALALIVATIYYFVVPAEAAQTEFLQEVILRYGHAVCWIFLGLASIVWGLKIGKKLPSLFAYMALAMYAIFIGTLLIVKYF